MVSTYTLNQGIEKPAAGDQSGTWGATVNTNMDIIDRVVSGVGALTLTGSTTTLTTTDGALSDGMYRVLVLGDGGDLGSNNTITLSPNDADKLYLVYNNLTANRSAIFTQGSGANATVENGETAWIYADGAGSGAAVRVATSSTKLLDQDGDTGIRVEEGGDDDDTIRFDIAGAEDFTMTANTLTALSGSTIATNTIAETTSTSGVTIDGLLIKDSTAAFADGAVATPSITNTGDLNTGVYFPAADTVGVTAGGTEVFRFGSSGDGHYGSVTGAKNMVINGSFNVSQRGTSAITGLGGANYERYPTDMWMSYGTTSAARYSAQQTTPGFGSGQPRAGNGLLIDCTTAESSVAAGDVSAVVHAFEAQNVFFLQYGTAGAATVTVSFWVSSPKTGIHTVALYNVDTNYGCPIEYTVSSTDTYELKTVTFPRPTSSATLVNDTGAGLWLVFPLVVGSNYQGTNNTWGSGEDYGTSNSQNLMDSTSNNFKLALVQMELGSAFTGFEHEDYGTTLEKCQRYYQQWNILTAYGYIASGHNAGTTVSRYILPTRQTMRAAPTLTVSNVADFQVQDGGGSKDTTNVTLHSSFPEVVTIAATPASSQTVSLASLFGADNSTARWLALSAELES